MAFFELGPGPRPLFEPGTWDVGHLEGGLYIGAAESSGLDRLACGSSCLQTNKKQFTRIDFFISQFLDSTTCVRPCTLVNLHTTVVPTPRAR